MSGTHFLVFCVFFFSEGKFKSFGLSNYTAWQVVSEIIILIPHFACELEGNYFPWFKCHERMIFHSTAVNSVTVKP